ncbi:MAG: hypothetical protein ACOH2J_00895 [Allorhizobium sp.]
MSRIPPIDYDSASDAVRAEHDRELQLRGRMTNMKRILLHSPAAHRIYAEWFTLYDELLPVLGARSIWIFSHAISLASASRIPVGFFRRALTNAGLDPDHIEPTEDERVLIDLAGAIVANSNAVPDGIWTGLKALHDDVVLVNLVAFAGIMLATAVFTKVVEVDLDPELIGYLGPDAP